jgi:hypothetical protein
LLVEVAAEVVFSVEAVVQEVSAQVQVILLLVALHIL